jgi:hypothetical protein
MAAGMVESGSDRGRTAPPHRVERRVYIKAVPRRVWTTLHDPSGLPRLYEELSFGPADLSWPAAGSRRDGEAHLGLLRTAVTIESQEARPERTFRIVIVAEGFTIDWTWLMEPLAGGTRVIHVGTFETRDRLAGVLVRLGRESIGGLAEGHLRALKERAETGTGEAAGPAA